MSDTPSTPKEAPKCRVCGGELKSGIAYVSILYGSPDFPGETGREPGCTLSEGPALYPSIVTKCKACGHSFTGTPKEAAASEAKPSEPVCGFCLTYPGECPEHPTPANGAPKGEPSPTVAAEMVTPRTNEYCRTHHVTQKAGTVEGDLSDFARTLERELAQAQAEKERLAAELACVHREKQALWESHEALFAKAYPKDETHEPSTLEIFEDPRSLIGVYSDNPKTCARCLCKIDRAGLCGCEGVKL